MYLYKFYATINSVTTEVFPLGVPDIEFVYEKESESIYFRIKLKGTLTFTNRPSESVTDWDYFYNIEQNNKCDLITLDIYRSCDLGVTYSFYPYWTGMFRAVDGKIDLDGCKFSVDVEPDDLYDCISSDLQVNALSAPAFGTISYKYFCVSGLTERLYTRARLLEDVLEYVATQTCSGITQITSDFFQINADNPDSINYVTGEYNNYRQLALSAISDIREPIPSDFATIQNISLLNILKQLNYLFNVYWNIEGTRLRIEHISYYNKISMGLDLTQSQYDKYTSGTLKYSYDKDGIPSSETWLMPDSTINDGGTHQLPRINYNNDCVSIKKEAIQYEILFYTDIYHIRVQEKHPENLNQFFLFALKLNASTFNYDVLGEYNNELILSVLIRKFHRNYRPVIDGASISLYGDFFIYDEKKHKKQDEFSIPLCCDDDLDTSKYILTDLGQGEIEGASYRVKNNMLKLSLKYGESYDDIIPSDLGHLKFWVKADAGVIESGGGVLTWEDQSGNGYDLTQATLAKRPTKVANQINFLPVIRFDGIDDVLRTSVAFQSFPGKRGSVFIVFKFEQPIRGQIDRIIGTHDGVVTNPWDITSAVDLVPTLNYKTLRSFSQGVDYVGGIMGEDLEDATYGCKIFTYGWSDYVLFELFRNSDTTFLTGGFGDIFPSTEITIANVQPDSAILSVGDQTNTPNIPFQGDIAEIIIYDTLVSELERQKIELYLSKKYSISLARTFV